MAGFVNVFQGASLLNLDAKGRLAVPARHREVLLCAVEGKLTITRHPDGCLTIYPRPEWERVREQIAALPVTAQWIKRLYLGNAVDVEIDTTGRVLVSPELRQAAGLSREVILMGLGNSFELWDKARYEAKEAQAMQQQMPDFLNHLSL